VSALPAGPLLPEAREHVVGQIVRRAEKLVRLQRMRFECALLAAEVHGLSPGQCRTCLGAGGITNEGISYCNCEVSA
jgi:hypothetical protein